MIFQNLNELFESFCYRRLNKLVSVQSIYLVKYNNETILVIYLQIYFIYDMQSANIGAVNFNTIFIIFTTFLIIRLLSTIRHFRTVVIMNARLNMCYNDEIIYYCFWNSRWALNICLLISINYCFYK